MNTLHDLYFSEVKGKIKVILSGQKTFGAKVYEMLREKRGIDLACVFAPPGDILYESAELYGTPKYPAGTLRAENIPIESDLLIAAHSHDFISRAVRNRLSLGAIGYHPSLLPLHRGKDAIKWALKMNDKITGGTVFWLNDTVDGGPIAAQEVCFIQPEDTASTLWRRDLFPLGIKLIEKVIDDILAGKLVMKEQDPELATWEPSFNGAPRLFRPELLQIGTLPEGFRIEK